MAILGTLAVFGGAWFAIYSLLSLLTFGSVALDLIAKLVGLIAGVILAVRVRREVKSQPPYISNTPYGWWP
jgi:membrane associated rhomboid family serine protease